MQPSSVLCGHFVSTRQKAQGIRQKESKSLAFEPKLCAKKRVVGSYEPKGGKFNYFGGECHTVVTVVEKKIAFITQSVSSNGARY